MDFCKYGGVGVFHMYIPIKMQVTQCGKCVVRVGAVTLTL